jgi:hypothetical protein
MTTTAHPETSFTVQTFNGHDTAKPARSATFVALQERGPKGWGSSGGLRVWYPDGLQEAIAWNPLRFVVEDKGKEFLHHSGKFYGHPDTTPERWALWAKGTLDNLHKVAFIAPHLINNAFGEVLRGERRLRRRLWRKGWRIVKRLRAKLRRQGYAVFILGDLNRTLRYWQKLGECVLSHVFDHIFYPSDVDLLESWTGDPNGSDHKPLFGRFRWKAKR